MLMERGSNGVGQTLQMQRLLVTPSLRSTLPRCNSASYPRMSQFDGTKGIKRTLTLSMRRIISRLFQIFSNDVT